ncbi:MAG: 3D domain-containing protein [Verrucomicrobiota bacterium]
MLGRLFFASLVAGVLGGLTSCSSLTGNNSLEVMEKARAQELAIRSAAKSPNGFHPAEANVAVLQSAEHLPKDKHGMPTYGFETTHRYVRTTAYSCAENEPGAIENFNAAGTRLKYTGTVRSAAADWSKYPVGTKFKIKGLPYTYVVDDYGSALTGTNTIDIYHPTIRKMNKWGTRMAEIDVIQWGSWERTIALLKGRRGYWHCKAMYDDAIANVQKIGGQQVVLVNSQSPKPAARTNAPTVFDILEN